MRKSETLTKLILQPNNRRPFLSLQNLVVHQVFFAYYWKKKNNNKKKFYLNFSSVEWRVKIEFDFEIELRASKLTGFYAMCKHSPLTVMRLPRY